MDVTFKTKVHVYYHGQAFSNSESFSALLRVNSGILSSQGLSSNACSYFSCYLSHWSFSYILSVLIFYSKIVLFLCIRLLVNPHAFPTYWLVNFSFIILECPVLFVLLVPVSVSFKPLIFLQYILINRSKMYCPTCLLFGFGLFIPTSPSAFFFP